MLLIVGLGNPGTQYATTRHNVGRQVVERLAVQYKIIFSQHRQTYRGVGTIGSHEVSLVLPQIWMNQSGLVVAELLHQLELTHENLIIVYDDLDLDFGTIRIKSRGGAGGHNGMRSILTCIETDQFCRLKVGIGHPPSGVEVADYVLSPFTSLEQSSMPAVLSHAADALKSLILDGAVVAMNRFNASPQSEKNE